MSKATKDQFDALRNDPYVKEAEKLAEMHVARYALAVVEAMRKRGMVGHSPHVNPVKLSFRRDDPNPWPGKAKVPAMLVSMSLEGMGRGLKTTRKRHNALIDEACRRCGGGANDTRSISVWRNPLQGHQLTNCKRLMLARGYKVPKAVDTVAGFFDIIDAGLQVTSTEQSSHLSRTCGHGIHAVTFFAANDMLYRGERFNLQWRKDGKACDPINGSATVAGCLNGKPIRKGLKALLVECKSITSAEWPDIKQTAHDVEQARVATEVASRLRADKEQADAERQEQLDAIFDEPM